LPLHGRATATVASNRATAPDDQRGGAGHDDDFAGQRVETENLGPMRMTTTVRVCLYALRAYLLLMSGMLGFRVLQLAGIIRG
jgi:hypothetical protein